MGLITSFIPHPPQPLCLDLAAAFPCACWLIRGWRLGVQRAQVSSCFGGCRAAALKWHKSSQTFCSLFLAFRNDKEHLCCCQQRDLCICQCSICHVIWHCTDITAALQVDITVFPAGGGLVWAGAKGSPILRGCTCLHVKTRPLYHLCAHKQVKMFLAGKCFLFPWNPPYHKDSLLPWRRKVPLAQRAELLGHTYRDDSCSHKDWLSIHLNIISRVQLLFQFLASLGIGRTSENAPCRGTFMVQEEQHILREKPVVLQSLTLYPLVCVYYSSCVAM